MEEKDRRFGSGSDSIFAGFGAEGRAAWGRLRVVGNGFGNAIPSRVGVTSASTASLATLPALRSAVLLAGAGLAAFLNESWAVSEAALVLKSDSARAAGGRCGGRGLDEMSALSTLPLVVSGSAERAFLLDVLLDEADDKAYELDSNWALLLLFPLRALSLLAVLCKGSMGPMGEIQSAMFLSDCVGAPMSGMLHPNAWE